MYKFLIHSFLNVMRNKRRTFTICSLLCISFIILFLTQCFLDGMYWGIKFGFVKRNGHIQIAAKGYWDDSLEEKNLLTDSQVVAIESTLKTNSVFNITAVEKEVEFNGLVGNENGSTVISGVGTRLGAFGGANAGVDIVDGRPIFESDEDAILIGTRVARKIGVDVDDWVTLFTQTSDGSFNPLSYKVVGIASVGYGEADLYYAALDFNTARTQIQSSYVDRVLVFFNEDSYNPEVVEQVKDLFSNFDVSIKTWEELSPIYFSLKNFYDSIFFFIMAVVIILVAVAICELMTLAYFERFQEIGTLRAIGTTRLEVFQVLIFESVLLFMLCTAVGMVSGWSLGQFLNFLDLKWTPPGSTSSVPTTFLLEMGNFIIPVSVSFFACCVASLIPALRVSTLKVIEVLKYE